MANDINKLSANLDSLSSKVLKLREKMKGLKEGSDEHLAATKKLNKALADQAKAQAKLENSGKTLTANNKNHTKTIRTKTEALRRATRAQQGATIADGKADKANKGLISSFGGRIATLGKYLIATKLIQLAVSALRVVFVDTAKEAIKFDGALGDLQAVTGSTNSELANLRRVALDTAGATKLTAVEVVGLQKELAKLGTSAEDIERLTKPIAQLSQALGETGGEVAKVFKSILNQFDLTTRRSVDVANIIQKTVASSALDLNALGTGFSYVGTQANLAGLNVEETAANLAVLSDNGLKASKAGTGFRNVLVAAVKSGKTYTQFIDDLAEKGLSASEAIELFGKRAATAGILLVRNRQAVKDLSEELNDNTAVFDAQIAQMGNAAGQVELLKSAYNRLQISIGQTIAKSDLFIATIKLLDRQTGDEAAFFKVLNTSSNETRDNVDALINRLGRLNEAGTEVQLNGNNNEIINKVLFETLTQGDRFEKAKQEYLDDIAKGVYTVQQRNFEEFLKSKGGFAGLASEATTQMDIIASQGRERMNGIADDVARATKPIADAIKTVNAFEAAALSGDYLEEEGLAYEAFIQKQLAARKQQLEGLKDIQDDEQALFDANPDNEGRLRRVSVNDEYLAEAQAGIDILEALAKSIVNLENTADEEAESGRSVNVGRRRSFDDSSIRAQEKAIESETGLRLELAKAEKDELGASVALTTAKTALNDLYGNFLSRLDSTRTSILAEKDALDLSTEFGKKKAAQLDSELLSLDKLILKYQEKERANNNEVNGLKDIANISEQRISDLRKDFKDGLIDATQFEEGQAKIIDTALAEMLKVAEGNPTLEAIAKALAEGLKGNLEKEDVENLISDSLAEILNNAIARSGEVYDAFAKERATNVKSQIDSDLEAIKNRYKTEEDILRSSLDNQLITEGQFRVKTLELRKAQLAEENALAKKLFDSKKQQDTQSAIADGAEAVASAVVSAYSTGDPLTAGFRAIANSAIIVASTGAKVAAIGNRKFVPKRFEQGGTVEGPSHAEGGVPFTVQGHGGYEMEGGEYIINKRSASMHKDLLDRINASGRTSATLGTQKFANGGEVVGIQGTDATVDYLRVIAESNADIATQSKKPTRAFVSSKDLTTDSRERSIRNNNDRV